MHRSALPPSHWFGSTDHAHLKVLEASMRKPAALLTGLIAALVVPVLAIAVPAARPAHASTDPNFLKASGKYLKNNSGTGSIVTLRGTNLGGWLTMEDWM